MSTVLSDQQVLHAFAASICVNIQTVELPPGLRSHKESEVFGWSRIFLSESDFGSSIGPFFTSHSKL